MRIDEVEQVSGESSDSRQLMGLANFLTGRAKDTNGPKQIDQATFVELAKSLGIPITKDQLPQLVSQPPMDKLFEPVDPNSGKLMFKGAEQPSVAMPVNRAHDIVAAAAKSAMKRGQSK